MTQRTNPRKWWAADVPASFPRTAMRGTSGSLVDLLLLTALTEQHRTPNQRVMRISLLDLISFPSASVKLLPKFPVRGRVFY